MLVSKSNPPVANNFRYERVAITKPRAIALLSHRGALQQPCPFSRSRPLTAILPILRFESCDPGLGLAEPAPLTKICPASLPFSRRDAGVPAVVRQQVVVLPELRAEETREELVPASAPAFTVELEMTRQTCTSKPRESWPIAPLESVTSSIQPLGVDDPDESSATGQRAKAFASVPPRVVGDAVKCRFMPAAPRQCLNLRAALQPEQGLFVPGLRIGTLRPRLAFGPKPETFAGRDDTPAEIQQRATPLAVGPTIVAKRGDAR